LTDDGRVVGVAVNSKGKTENIRANKGVVVATGGAHTLRLAAQREGWRLAVPLGAALHADPIIVPHVLVPVPEVIFPDGTRALRSNYEPYMPHGLVVNRFGERFGNEAFFQDLGSMVNHFDTEGEHRFRNLPCYLIFDRNLASKYAFGGLPPGSADVLDWVTKGKTLAEIATQFKIPAAKLDATVARFNQHCRQGNDPDFNRNPKTLGTVETAPFYGVELFTMDPFEAENAIVTNTKAQVLHYETHEPIPGLYACGPSTWLVPILGIGYQGGGDLRTRKILK